MNSHNTKKMSIILVMLSCVFGIAMQACSWKKTSEPQDDAAFYASPHVSVLEIASAPVAGVVINEKLEIVRVEPGSAAQSAGIHIGDKILTIGDKAVSTIGDLRRIVLNAKGQFDVPDTTPILDPDPQKQAAIDAAAAQATQQTLVKQPNTPTIDMQVMRNNTPLHITVTFMPQKSIDVSKTPTPVPVQAFYF